ncbi:MAG: glycosyltransferase family 4 protein, partial [Actinomycetota bacterium]
MRIALFSTQGAVGLPTEYGTHVREVARMLRLLGHECLLVGLASRAPRDAAAGHAGGTRRRLLPDFGGHGDLPGVTELLEEEQPDVVWLLQWRMSRQFLDAAAARGVPVVADLHGLFCPVDARTSGERRLDRQLADHAAHPGYAPDDERYVLAASHLVVTRFDWDAEAARREGVGTGRIRRVPFGIRYATPNGQVPGARRRAGAEPCAAFAGPLVHTAGAHLLLDAMALVPDLPVRLVMEARGPGDKEYEELVAVRAGDDPRVTVVLDPPSGPSPIVSGAADLLVVPSLVPGACPVVALAAGASGVRVAASEAAGPGIPFACGDGDLFETGNAAAIAEVLERL